MYTFIPQNFKPSLEDACFLLETSLNYHLELLFIGFRCRWLSSARGDQSSLKCMQFPKRKKIPIYELQAHSLRCQQLFTDTSRNFQGFFCCLAQAFLQSGKATQHILNPKSTPKKQEKELRFNVATCPLTFLPVLLYQAEYTVLLNSAVVQRLHKHQFIVLLCSKHEH